MNQNPSTTSKNLGLVKLVYIGVTPPANILQIWIDISTNPYVHKYYNTQSGTWVPLSGGGGGAVGWALTGNAIGNNDAASFFVGTTTDEDFWIFVNNEKRAVFRKDGESMFGNEVTIGNLDIGIGTFPDQIAVSRIVSSNKGCFPYPKLTSAQRDTLTTVLLTIDSPDNESLHIYNLTTHKINFWDGAVWRVVTSV